jgi:hypothetical protein
MQNFTDPDNPKHLICGDGWRIGWRSDVEIYRGLVGSEQWAIELTDREFRDCCKLIRQLAETMQLMESELSDCEKISCTLETEDICLEASGYPHAFSLYLQVLKGRKSEGFWDAAVVPHLLEAIAHLSPFANL